MCFSLDSGLLNQASVSRRFFECWQRKENTAWPTECTWENPQPIFVCKETMSFWSRQEPNIAQVFIAPRKGGFLHGRRKKGANEEEGGERRPIFHSSTRRVTRLFHKSNAYSMRAPARRWVHHCCRLRGGEVRQRVWSDATV